MAHGDLDLKAIWRVLCYFHVVVLGKRDTFRSPYLGGEGMHAHGSKNQTD